MVTGIVMSSPGEKSFYPRIAAVRFGPPFKKAIHAKKGMVIPMSTTMIARIASNVVKIVACGLIFDFITWSAHSGLQVCKSLLSDQ